MLEADGGSQQIELTKLRKLEVLSPNPQFREVVFLILNLLSARAPDRHRKFVALRNEIEKSMVCWQCGIDHYFACDQEKRLGEALWFPRYCH